MKIELLLTGDELMTGDVIDTNSALVARALLTEGLAVCRKTTLGDDLPALVAQLRQLSRSADVLLVNGGLGPTRDDYTAQALAEAAGLPLVEHAQALADLQAWCAARGYPMSEAVRKQAMLPAGCDLLPNKVGSAPGFCLNLNGCLVLCTPGVPVELDAMLTASVVPAIMTRYRKDRTSAEGGVGVEDSLFVKKLQVFGLGESAIEARIRARLPDWPAHIRLGFRAGSRLTDVKLTTQTRLARQEVPYWCGRLRDILGAHVIGEDDASVADALVKALLAKNLKVTTAESCTGGRLASAITAIAGASAVFEAGWVTYANTMKTQLLGVDALALEREGAVSEPVVRQMLAGALARSGADLGVAVSGIAGPGGGSPAKPVGLVWIAWGQAQAMRAQALYFPAPRDLFQLRVTQVGLDLMRRLALGLVEPPAYLSERAFLPPQA